MPDATFKTVSASEVAALFGHSPYKTEWMLWQEFRRKRRFEQAEDERIGWGRRLETAILQAVADENRIEVLWGDVQVYIRHPDLPIGATVDAECRHHEKGWGVVEAKNVDYLIWRNTWPEGGAPAHIELQLQTQMLVLGVHWGIIAALVGGNDLHIIERKPCEKIHAAIIERVRQFLADVEAGREPDPVGTVRELDFLRELYPETVEQKTVGWFEPEADDYIELFVDAAERRAEADKVFKSTKAQLMARAKDAQFLAAPHWEIKIGRAKNGVRLYPRRVGL